MNRSNSGLWVFSSSFFTVIPLVIVVIFRAAYHSYGEVYISTDIVVLVILKLVTISDEYCNCTRCCRSHLIVAFTIVVDYICAQTSFIYHDRKFNFLSQIKHKDTSAHYQVSLPK